MLQVADTGIGMSPEQIPVALAVFGQVDTRLARRYEGTGLGLPLVKSIVELHGGEIDIDSAAGQGTTVTVSLPREQAMPAAGGSPALARAGGLTGRAERPPAVTARAQGAIDLIPPPAIVRRNDFGG